MTLSRQLAWLDTFQGSGIVPGLERMRRLLDEAENPERGRPSVLIAGTNGKGSTAATLTSICASAGLRVALYTSPHLVDIRERWRLGDASVSEEELSAAIERLRVVIERSGIRPTYFEALTIIAFFIFEQWNADLKILEVGMGGRLDATNVVEPLLSLITPIGMDHMEFLGVTIEEIAREKSGIIHEGSVVLTSNRERAALDVILDVAGVVGVPCESIGSFARIENVEVGEGGTLFDLSTPERRYTLSTPLAGEHQTENVALAVRAAEHLASRFRISREQIVRGVEATFWRGRLERFECGASIFWVDGGHNAHAASRIRNFVEARIASPRTLLFAMMKDKDVEETAKLLFPLFDRIVATQVDSERGLTPEAIVSVAQSLGIEAKPASTLEAAITDLAGSGDRTLVAGSLYLAGAAIALLDEISNRPTRS